MATSFERRNRNQYEAGLRFLLLGGGLALIGFIIVLLTDAGGLTSGIGVAFLALGTLPTIVGLVLLGAAFFERRSREGKPYT
jgi:hypothetical protein